LKKNPAGGKTMSCFSRGRPVALMATALLVAMAVLLGSAGTLTAASVVATIPVLTYPEGVGVNPSTNKIYVASNYTGYVSVIEGATNTTDQYTIGGAYVPESVDVNPNTNKIYVAGGGSTNGCVVVINGATGYVTSGGGAVPGADSVAGAGAGADVDACGPDALATATLACRDDHP